MKRIGIVGTVLAAMAFGAVALAFEAYFSDAAGNKIGWVQEGRPVYIAIKDPEKGACGIAEFPADIVVFDFKTGAYLGAGEDALLLTDVVFRELGGIGSGLYFWVAGRGSSTKVSVQIGSRYSYTAITGQTHVLGVVSPTTIEDWAGTSLALVGWKEGAWEYVDEDVVDPANVNVEVAAMPQGRQTARISFEGFIPTFGNALPAALEGYGIQGRFENMDTLILIAADDTDERNIDQDQVKIVDTVAKLTVPSRADYGCPPACKDLIVKVEDKDENLNCNEIEYVPVFVIINPGSWNSAQTPTVNSFCALMVRGGYSYYDDDRDVPWNEPIRWYNIYSTDRYMNYDGAVWWPAAVDDVIRVVMFVPETAVDSGVFELNLGNLEDFQQFLWEDAGARNYRLPMGTTIAFYYIDPNDFDDMTLGTMEIGDRPHSQTFLTDANGIPVSEVKIGAGWGGLYVRVYDADANVEACCQDKVVVHICDPHNEDDSEYYVIDEISNNSGIFFTQNGIPLLPVWDAVGGYQLVFDDWKVQAFNEDTVFVRYNSVDYVQTALNALGDGNPNDRFFPPGIDEGAARNQYWDVSFALAKVYDYQVFDGTTHRMRFLDGEYRPVTQIPPSGSLYLEVTDLDQNEHPMLRESISADWNKDANPDIINPEHSDPIWWWQPFDYVDLLTPDGAVPGGVALNFLSISGKLPTVKIFMWNAQRGTWERMDLRETAVGSGIFRSVTCVLVADPRFPGVGNLGSKGGDTIMALYQDPSNHSDISIISIKVLEGGAGAVTPPVVELSVAFDRTTYYPGDRVTITVTDEQYAGAAEIVGTKVLVLLDKDGGELASWNRLEAVDGQPGQFRVTYVLPENVKLGTITAKYTDPYMPTRTVSDTATVQAKALQVVTGITVSPNPFSTSTTFSIVAQPSGAVAEKITVTIYDLTGAKVAGISGTNTASVTWNGGNLRNGAYIYVAVVENAGRAWTFKGFVYIER